MSRGRSEQLQAQMTLHDDSGPRDSVTLADSQLEWRSGPVEKLLLVSSSILPLVASIYLLVLTVTDSRSTGYFLYFVSEYRAATQVLVSILAAVLSSLNVYTATKLLNLATRINLLRRPFRLNAIKLAGAIGTRSFSSNLPWGMSAMSAAAILLFALPNVIWTGALTPVIISTTRVEAGGLKIPQYSNSSRQTWANSSRLKQEKCTVVVNDLGQFGNCPANIIQSSMLHRAALATSDRTQLHLKGDNSKYSYTGRSFGVGAAAGLVDDSLYASGPGSELLAYAYKEPGYATNVSCFRNTTSDFRLKQVQPGKKGNGIPWIYYALGNFPNAPFNHSVDFYSVMGLSGPDNLASMAAKRYLGRSVVLLTAGSHYLVLNQSQCEVSFQPTMMDVRVDVANKTISVSPSIEPAASFDPTGRLAGTATDELNYLGMMSTSLHTSVVGDALAANMAAVLSQVSPSSLSKDPASSIANFTSFLASSDTPSDEMLAALSDSIAAMIDEVLVFVGSSQFFVARDTAPVDATVTVQAVRLGDPRFVFIVFTLCVLLVLSLGVEAARTRTWRQLPKWDFADPICLVLAGAVGGDEVREEMQSSGWKGQGVQWAGDGGDQGATGDLRIRLGRRVVHDASWSSTTHMDPGSVSDDGEHINAVSVWIEGSRTVSSLQ